MKGAVASRRKQVPAQAAVITDSVLAFSSGSQRGSVQPFAVPDHPPGVMPLGHGMAMDDSLSVSMSWAGSNLTTSMYAGGADHFIGYPELALLAQRPEYRRVSETIATEMTRKWIRFQAVGDADKTEKISKIEAAFKRFHIRDVFREAAQADGEFGRGHIYIDLGTTDDDELKTPIGDGHDKVSAAKVGRGSLKGFKTVEAVWCYPMNYNAHEPLSDDWYNPASWLVMRKEIHKSRLLTFIGREVPDLLKPAYSFGGLSLTQMVMPTVESWLRTKRSVEELIHSFSVSGITTNLTDQLNENPDSPTGLHRRVQLFNNLRDNKGLMVLNNQAGVKGEEFFNVSTPLGTLDHLQAQSQEHICSVSGLPLIKYTGLTPSGLNASSDGEMRSWYDWVHSYQELLFSSKITTILGFVQLNEFGSVDPDITFEYEPLWSLDEKSLAEKQKIEAETDQVHIATGVIASSEARQRVAGDPDTPYAGLDLKDAPGAADKKVEYGAKATTAVVEAFTAGLINHAQGLKELLESSKESGIFTSITPEDIKEAEAEPPPSEMAMVGEGAPPNQQQEPEQGQSETSPLTALNNRPPLAGDAFEESKHPRGQPENAGQFGAGGGSGASPSKPKGQNPTRRVGEAKEETKPRNLSEEFRTAKNSGKVNQQADIAKTLIPVAYATNASRQTKEQRVSIGEYKESAYEDINSVLRGGKISGDRSEELLKQYTANIDSLIADSKLSEPITVFRGMNVDPSKIEQGKTFIDKGFVSTSADDNVPDNFNPKVRMQIHLPKGANAFIFENDSIENEILLPRESRFKIISVEETDGIHNVIAQLVSSKQRPHTAADQKSKDAPEESEKSNKYIWDAADIEWVED